jgi:DNA-binding NarL/FixJ family response regulator
MIGIGIIEDDAQIRTVLQTYFDRQSDMTCLGAFESVEKGLAGFDPKVMPDVMLMDIELPGMSGIEGVKLLKQRHPSMEFIILTIYHDVSKIFPALQAGASGYLLKNTPLPDIKDGILQVQSGGSPMSPQIARRVVDAFTNRGKDSDKDEKGSSILTEREDEIVIALVDGLSYKMIADRMSISIETVRYHIRNIYKKLHVHSKGEVISKSLRGEI